MTAGVRAADSPPPTMTVLAYDYEGVPAAIRNEAERQVTRIYREIGVDVRWREASSRVGTPVPDGQTFVVVMAIVSDAMTAVRNPSDDVLGTAPRGREGMGWIAYAFYPRIDALARRYQNGRVAPILANVIAHEIGHLLLPLHAHSDLGIMRADWTPMDIALAVRGGLRFTSRQGEIIRQRLTDAMTSAASANTLFFRDRAAAPIE